MEILLSLIVLKVLLGFPGGASGKEPTCQCRRCKRHRVAPWVRKTPRRRAWPPAPVFLPGESHGWRGWCYSPWGGEESDTTEAAKHACTLTFWLREACVCTRVYSFLGIKAQSARSLEPSGLSPGHLISSLSSGHGQDPHFSA